MRRQLLTILLSATVSAVVAVTVVWTIVPRPADAAAPAQRIVASEVDIVDDQGQVRAILGMVGAQPALALYDAPKPGQPSPPARVSIGLPDSGDSLITLAPPNASNGGGMFLSAGPSGSGIAISTVGAEFPGFLALVTPQIGGTVAVRDSSGNFVWSAP